MREFQKVFACAIVLGCAGFSMCTGESSSKTASWPESAAVAAEQLRSEGMRCTEEGRELYPIVYDCSMPDDGRSGHVYLYADDGNELEGIRAFADEIDMGTFQTALRLVYSGSAPVSFDELRDASWQNNLPDSWIVETGSVAESGEDDQDEAEADNVPTGLHYLRITPRHRVANQ